LFHNFFTHAFAQSNELGAAIRVAQEERIRAAIAGGKQAWWDCGNVALRWVMERVKDQA